MGNRFARLCLLLAAASLICATARAQDYPNRRITIVVPNTAGGGVDTVSRLVATALQAKWGQTVVVENRTGGNGNIGAQRVASAAPDGYTLLASAEVPLIMNQSLYSSLSYDPKAFVPVSIVSASPIFLVVHPSLPVKSVDELVAYAKAHPGEISYGTPGVGTPTHLVGVMLETKADIKMTQVPYKGSSQALSDFLGGHINMLFAFESSAGPYFGSDKMRLLAVSSPQRETRFPEVPAMSETLPGFSAQSVVALVAPPGTPPAIARKLSDAVAEAVKSPELSKRLVQMGSTPIGNTPEEAGAYLKEVGDSWGRAIRTAGIKVD
ncbi:MAG: tripartite tricarboxylate transporter substrate binding protein [Rhizobiales bacterium]|nr:tripartite tricarboxylate transporter substrate binding protein [Hyphomicrobiales bacterium]